jgi:hypothetical protein
MQIELECENCKSTVVIPASGQPFSVPATLCPRCNALLGRVILPGRPVAGPRPSPPLK